MSQVSRFPIFSPLSTPQWVHHQDPFHAVVALGFSPLTLQEMAFHASEDPIIKTALKRGNLFFVIPDAKTPLSETLTRHVTEQSWEVRNFPAKPGDISHFWELLFADVVGYVNRQSLFSRCTARVIRSIPEIFSGIGGGQPEWHQGLQKRVFLSGFKPAEGDSIPDLCIETYDGPFPLLAGRRKKMEITFTPPSHETLPPGRFSVRFVHPETAEADMDLLIENGILVASRFPPGDILVRGKNGSRLIPHLTDRPAIWKFLDLVFGELSVVLNLPYVHE